MCFVTFISGEICEERVGSAWVNASSRCEDVGVYATAYGRLQASGGLSADV